MKTNFLKLFAMTPFIMLCLSACNALESSEYPVVDSGMIVNGIGNFHWLDNDHMLFYGISEGEFKAEKKKKENASSDLPLFIWTLKTNQLSTLILDKDADSIKTDFFSTSLECVANQYLLFSKGKWIPTVDKNGQKSGIDETYWYKMPFHILGERIQFEDVQKLVGNIDDGTEIGPIDPKNCIWKGNIKLPEWANLIPKQDITLLKPEHGFLVLDRDSYKAPPKGLYFYPPNSINRESKKDLFKEMHVVPNQDYGTLVHKKFDSGNPEPDLEYFAFKNAYRIKILGADSYWWLYTDGHLEKSWKWNEYDPKLNSNGEWINKDLDLLGRYIPTAKMPVAGGYSDIEFNKYGSGLYAFTGDPNNPKRLIKGRVGSDLEVSPNGCKVAFINDERFDISDGPEFKLQVIDLCKGDKNEPSH